MATGFYILGPCENMSQSGSSGGRIDVLKCLRENKMPNTLKIILSQMHTCVN